MARADELAQTDAERASLDALREATGEVDGPMERHCLRMFLIGERIAAQRSDTDFDRELLCCAALLHEIGIYPSVSTGDVYVTDGRRFAERLLARFEWPPERLAVCLDAIEQHHARASRWDWGTEVELIRRADLVDVTRGIYRSELSRAWLGNLWREIPRTGFWRTLARLLWHMARERPRTMIRIPAPGRTEPTRQG